MKTDRGGIRIGGMSEDEHSLTTGIITGAGVLMLLAIVLAGTAAFFLVLALTFGRSFTVPAALTVSALAIRILVRWLNHRHDPRHARRPPNYS